MISKTLIAAMAGSLRMGGVQASLALPWEEANARLEHEKVEIRIAGDKITGTPTTQHAIWGRSY